MSERLKVILAYTAVCTIWGSTWLVIKLGLETMTPLLSAGLRFTVAAVVLFTIIRLQRIEIPWTRETRWFYFVIALTSFSIPFGLVYWGEQRIPSGMTSVLFATFPLWVAIISSLLIPQDKVTAGKVTGVLLGFAGVVTIFWNDLQFSGSRETMYGMGAVVLSGMIQALSAVLIKKHGEKISPFVVSFMPMAISAVLLLTAAGVSEDIASVQWTPMGIFSIVFLAVLGTVVTFVSYFWLLKRVQVVILSLTSFVTPIIAVVLGVVVLNESVSPFLFAGAALVFLGIGVANSRDLRSLLRRTSSTS